MDLSHESTGIDGIDILLELMPGGSVKSLLDLGPLNEVVIRRFIKQILEGLKYLHEKKIVHKNLKCSNVLVDNNSCIKVSGFGTLKEVVGEVLKGSVYWAAPEVVKNLGASKASDIWNLGCVMIEMSTGKPPWFDIKDEQTVLQTISETKTGPPLPNSELTAPALEFLKKCLQINPEDRATVEELLQDDFLTHLNTSINSVEMIFERMQSIGKNLTNRKRSIEHNEIQYE
jgi:mitogen-activated protein kinase kinase kinase